MCKISFLKKIRVLLKEIFFAFAIALGSQVNDTLTYSNGD